ncbi:KamA family radical SAM protein [Amycolatopsis sp. cmx-11-12]|uniref:KamA family radical SAM protein n=1 Tax=Amycolatopsis sp. cmx-11-12 TaxID=2785795 RepID=UPI003917BAE7
MTSLQESALVTTGRNTGDAPVACQDELGYRRRELVEPDWRRLPGWADVTEAQWRDPQWQRVHCVRTIPQLRALAGPLLHDSFYADLVEDQRTSATMSMLVTPQMLNTMAPFAATNPDDFTDAFLADPIRRYMLPVASDRNTVWRSHPYSERDSLHEAEMWAVEGLTHRYPAKVLAELISTCPQYCGHCTRMDLVGNSTPQVAKNKLELRPVDRRDAMIDYLRRTPSICGVVVSGGDVANVPWPQLESFLLRLLEIDHIRDIGMGTKALAGLPQHWLQPKVLDGIERVATLARRRAVNLSIHTHINHAQTVTPLVAEASHAAFERGVRDIRNQGVLMRGINDSAATLLSLCFALHGEANILPYYLYMCDMIPNAEHWRLAVWEAQELQHRIMGYLPGYATPRVVCDVPYVGKRWVHQVDEYDREKGISYWTKNYRTGTERTEDTSDEDILRRRYPYYDPIGTLGQPGQDWWHKTGQYLEI